MLFYVIIYLIFRNVSPSSVGASPMLGAASSYPLPISLSSLKTTSLDSTPLCNCNQRSVLDIIWGCASTLFLCTWVTIHPNVPDPNEEGWKTLWRRLKIMYWSIVAPELVLTWASHQYVGARMLFHQYKMPERNWTMKHAHFLQMGGFHLRSKEYSGVLDPKKFGDFLKKQKISFPNITKEEIQDKSKADGLSKIVFLIQTLWFVIQCIGRRAQGLPLVQLEVVTLAIISSTSVLSLLWLNKPFDVRHPIYLEAAADIVDGKGKNDTTQEYTPLYMIPVEGDSDGPNNGQAANQQKALAMENDTSTIRKMKLRYAESIHYPPGCVVIHHLRKLCNTMYSIGKAVDMAILTSLHEGGILFTILNVTLKWPFIMPIGTMVQNGGHIVYPGRVSMYFCVNQHTRNKYMDRLKEFAIPLSYGTLSGMIYRIAWDAHFPTTVEKTLWQISAIAIPATLDLLMYLSVIIDDSKWITISLIVAAYISLVILVPAYLASQYYLMLESLLALRALPPRAFETVQWSNFLLHM
ncbi:hypothetical protein BDQ17DRAFT_1543855 [Cyathus striatus]|nr:hypothetical protein BDQ17DRAFT_1543855 [Cyathus striatus]